MQSEYSETPEGKILRLMREGDAPRKKPSTRKRKSTGTINVDGSGNIVSGRDTIVTQRVNKSVRRAPLPGGLTPVQQRAVHRVVDQLVEREVAADISGDPNLAKRRAYSKWWRKIKNRYEVASYLDIPTEQGASLVAWLKQQRAIKRSKLRRNAPDAMRKDTFNAIWGCAKELGLSKGEVYGIAAEKLGKQVTSLGNLNQRSLDRLRSTLFAMKRRK